MLVYFNSGHNSRKSLVKNTNEKDHVVENIQPLKDEKLNILFWNGFWNWPFFGMGVGNRGFVSNKCKYQNCYTTNQRKKITNSHTRVDAIVVHGFDEDLARLASTTVSTVFCRIFISCETILCFDRVSWEY